MGKYAADFLNRFILELSAGRLVHYKREGIWISDGR